MRLWAISDLHVGFAENRDAVERLEPHPDDWLIVAGDTGETPAHLQFVIDTLSPRFGQLIWVPGNHDLWTPASLPPERRGQAHYDRLVALCRARGVLTPEDPYPLWPGEGPPRVIVPLFLLFDYSFRPPDVAREHAVAWAAASGVRSVDERLLATHPFDTVEAWCHARVAEAHRRLEALPENARLILVNHFPLRYELAQPPRVPRFSIWSGTRLTEDWHTRFNVEAAISGHLHLRSTRVIDDVRFEEVSLGYPRQWDQSRGLAPYLRRIL
jgi:3',5'-cyclic AMP phosphodiesterase CpdA